MGEKAICLLKHTHGYNVDIKVNGSYSLITTPQQTEENGFGGRRSLKKLKNIGSMVDAAGKTSMFCFNENQLTDQKQITSPSGSLSIYEVSR